jgi:hypothetical protein
MVEDTIPLFTQLGIVGSADIMVNLGFFVGLLLPFNGLCSSQSNTRRL